MNAETEENKFKFKFKIFCHLVLLILYLRNTYFQVSITFFLYRYIQSMQFPVITYAMALYINDTYVYRQNTNIKKIYVYASERSERA